MLRAAFFLPNASFFEKQFSLAENHWFDHMPLETPSDGPLDRALAILDFVASQRKPVTTVEIAQELGLPVPTAHRLISNLEARQMVQKAPGTKRFWVAIALWCWRARPSATPSAPPGAMPS